MDDIGRIETFKCCVVLSCVEIQHVLCVHLQVMCMSENKILTQCFDREELSDKKRPDTVRNLTVCVSSCSKVLPAGFPHLENPSMRSSLLSHSTTNSGVLPLLSGQSDRDSLRLPTH